MVATDAAPIIGVLALQGGFRVHAEQLRKLGARVIEVRKESDLASARGIVIPGGESTTLLKLIEPSFRSILQREIRAGMAVLATCAGLILLAREVTDPAQESLDLLDVSVARNAYGRQQESFESRNIVLTQSGIQMLESEHFKTTDAARFSVNEGRIEGVFIRAPRVTRVGPSVQILATLQDEPVLLCHNNILAAAFHPELSTGLSIVHELFLRRAVGGLEPLHERQLALL